MTQTVIVRERITPRQWKRDAIGVLRRIARSLGIDEHAAYELELELIAPVNGRRRKAVIAVRYSSFSAANCSVITRTSVR